MKGRRQITASVEAKARPSETGSRQLTLSCVADGRNITLTMTGNLTPLRAGMPLPEKGAKICMVNGSRTAGSPKVANNLMGFCQEDKRDATSKLVFGPMAAIGGSFDRFTFYFLAVDASYYSHGTHFIKFTGACRYIEDTESFMIVGGNNAAPARRTR